jgi:hypothetical protein
VSDRKTRPCARLHVGLASSRKPSAGGFCSFNVLIDRATQYYCVFIHKTEDASGEVVMDAFNGLQRESHTVKAIEIGGDAVNMSHEFRNLLKSQSIVHHSKSGYPPQSNGRAKRAIGVPKANLQFLLSNSGLKDIL